MEYKPLLDSSNMMETDWGKIASDLFVRIILLSLVFYANVYVASIAGKKHNQHADEGITVKQ